MVFYTALRYKWTIDELISVCLQKEDRVNGRIVERADMIMLSPSKKGNNNINKFKVRETLRTVIKTYPALAIFSMRVLRDMRLVSSVRKIQFQGCL